MLDPFLEMMAAERGASPHTLDAYRRDLLDFGGFARGRGRERAEADADDIRAYLASLAAAGASASTAAGSRTVTGACSRSRSCQASLNGPHAVTRCTV